jgi:hypothetical protein
MERTYESAAALAGRATGPLTGHLVAFVTWLIDQQFAASVIYIKVQHALAFDRWLAEGGVPLADLGEVHVSRYQHRSRRRHQRIFDAPLVVDFLDELEKVRDVMPRTRNLRLTAIHSLFRYIAFEAPAHAAQTQRVLAIPAKRFTRALIPFLADRKSMRCSRHPIGVHGQGDAITPSFCSPCRPDYVCRS